MAPHPNLIHKHKMVLCCAKGASGMLCFAAKGYDVIGEMYDTVGCIMHPRALSLTPSWNRGNAPIPSWTMSPQSRCWASEGSRGCT